MGSKVVYLKPHLEKHISSKTKVANSNMAYSNNLVYLKPLYKILHERYYS